MNECKHENFEWVRSPDGLGVTEAYKVCKDCGAMIEEYTPEITDLNERLEKAIAEDDLLMANRYRMKIKARTGEGLDPEHLAFHWEVGKIMRGYCCSACWHDLVCVFVEPEIVKKLGLKGRNTYIYCPQCTDKHGFVTKNYKEIKTDRSHDEYMKARSNLKGILPDEQLNIKANIEVDEILATLGYGGGE